MYSKRYQCGITRTYSQMHCADKHSQHSSIIWTVWLNGWVFVYELSDSGFESSCSQINMSLTKGKYVSWPEASKGWRGFEGQYGQRRIALCFVSDFRLSLIALGIRYVGTRIFVLFYQSNEKAFMSSFSRYKYLELNLLDSRLTSEANLSIDIFPQRCSRKLINCWVAYQSSK